MPKEPKIHEGFSLYELDDDLILGKDGELLEPYHYLSVIRKCDDMGPDVWYLGFRVWPDVTQTFPDGYYRKPFD